MESPSLCYIKWIKMRHNGHSGDTKNDQTCVCVWPGWLSDYGIMFTLFDTVLTKHVFVYGQTGTKFAKVSVALPVTLEFAKDGRIRSNDCSWIGVFETKRLTPLEPEQCGRLLSQKIELHMACCLVFRYMICIYIIYFTYYIYILYIYILYIIYIIYIYIYYIMIWYDRFIVW